MLLTVVEEIKNNVWRPYVDTLLHCNKFVLLDVFLLVFNFFCS